MHSTHLLVEMHRMRSCKIHVELLTVMGRQGGGGGKVVAEKEHDVASVHLKT